MSISGTVDEEDRNKRLGWLLKTLGLVSDAELEKALRIAGESRLPLGKALVVQECISDNVLKAALDAQWMLRDGFLSYEQAFEAVHMVRRNKWPFADALITMGLDAYATKGARLGELLSASGCLNESDLEKGLKTAEKSGMPLGRVLFMLDIMPEQSLTTALELQHDVRVGKLPIQDGVNKLRQTKYRRPEIKTPTSPRIGEILFQAGAITEADVTVAADIAAANGQMIGSVMVDFGYVSQELLDIALELQTLIRKGKTTSADVTKALKAMQENGLAHKDVLALSLCAEGSELEKKLTLYELLKLSGYMSHNKLSTTVTRLAQEPAILDDAAVEAGSDLPPAGNNKELIKAAVQDSAVLVNILTKLFPDEKESINNANKVREQVNAGSLRLDRALIQLAMP